MRPEVFTETEYIIVRRGIMKECLHNCGSLKGSMETRTTAVKSRVTQHADMAFRQFIC